MNSFGSGRTYLFSESFEIYEHGSTIMFIVVKRISHDHKDSFRDKQRWREQILSKINDDFKQYTV